ncbi:MAG TPA: amylo-alpha-1,6-glucosidase [Chitinophagaceae bacterium]
MITLSSPVLGQYDEAVQYEWLDTNGLGGWSGSTVTGCNTRRYHGLLVAATRPPTERMVLLSKLDETIACGNERFELGTNDYGQVVHPTGFQYLTGFNKDLFPGFMYEAGGIKLKKTIAMVQGENTVLILYDVVSAAQPFVLELLPLLSVRFYHSLVQANDAINREASFDKDVFKVRAYEGTPGIFIKVPGAQYRADPNWYYHFNYSEEAGRGLDFTEDLFTHGVFSVALKQGDSLGIIVSTDEPGGRDAHALLLAEQERKQRLLAGQPEDALLRQLLLAADQFIVQRDKDLKTVIAGYHWFTDWGRDTMISLPGLCLSTGRLQDARKILSAFANSVSQGMLPNRFPDGGEAPEYNTVDGTLWYFIAVYKYWQAGGDRDFVLKMLLPVLKDITDWHFKGTRYHIRMQEDGLLFAGEEGQQLTWMDAKVGGWVVTPRMGKPVEIQALWYNALKIVAVLLEQDHRQEEAAVLNAVAEKTKQAFSAQFWYAEGNYLYDVIDEQGRPDATLRPNQLFAISLPFALLEAERAGAVIKLVEEQLYTPPGLKTLPASDSRYVPVYVGDQYHRDAAYHQGTVWSWLLGPYIDAMMKVYASIDKARQVIDAFKYHLSEACIGSVSEIFDADAPHHPRGCVAQAWGVAEILRVIKDYEL